jgi:hypothetical protein
MFAADTIAKIRDYILTSRWSISFTSYEILKIAVKKFFCRKWCYVNSSRDWSGDSSKLHLYKRGKRHLMKELDCISILSRMRNLELIINTLLTSKQRLMMSLQKKGHILRNRRREKTESSRPQDGFDTTSSSNSSGNDTAPTLQKKMTITMKHSADITVQNRQSQGHSVSAFANPSSTADQLNRVISSISP